MDALFRQRTRATLKPHSCLARYLVTKHSWRGAYRRLLCITPTEIFTQDPQQSLRVTNSYSIGLDADIDGLTVGPGPDDFALLARPDKKTRKFSPLKFSCKQRAALLTDLFQCIIGVTAIKNAGLANKILSSGETFQGHRWSRKQGAWLPITLQCACFQLVCLDPGKGKVLWRTQYMKLTAPHALLALADTASVLPDALTHAETGDGAGSEAAATPPVSGVFAVLEAGRIVPKLLASSSREVLLAAIQSQASKRLGIDIIADRSTLDGHTVLRQATQAQSQAASQVCETPLAEWEVSWVRPRLDVQPVLSLLPTPHLLSRPQPTPEPIDHLNKGVLPEGGMVPRHLVLTSGHLVERKSGCYSLVRAHPLTSVAAVLRFTEDPQMLGVEWNDGSPPSVYLSPSRGAILAALLDAAQVALGAPVPILPGLTAGGDMVKGAQQGSGGGGGSQSGAADAGSRDVARWMCDELVGRARDSHATLNASSRMLFTAEIDFKPTPYSHLHVTHLHGASSADLGFREPHTYGSTPLTGPSVVNSPPNGPALALDAAAAAAATESSHIANGAATMPGTAWVSDSVELGSSPGGGNGVAAAAPAPEQPPSGPPNLARVSILNRGKIPPPILATGPINFTFPDGLMGAGRSMSSALDAPPVKEAVAVMMEAVADFNSAMPYSGVHVGYRLDPTAAAALLALLPPELQAGLSVPLHLPVDDTKNAVLVLQCLQRLAASHLAADTLLAVPGAVGRIYACLQCGEEHIAVEAARLLLRFLSPHTSRVGAVPWRTLRGGGLAALGGAAGDVDPCFAASNADLELSKGTKTLLFTPSQLRSRVTTILAPLKREQPSCSPLLSLALVELITAIVTEPGNATTEGVLLSTMLGDCASLGRPLFTLFHHPAERVAEGVAVLMRAIAGSGTTAAAPMREAALREGAMLHHLLLATSSLVTPRTLLSRDLVASWADEFAPALALLRRVFPAGLIRFLNAPRPKRATAPAAPPPQPSPPMSEVGAPTGPAPPEASNPTPPLPIPQAGPIPASAAAVAAAAASLASGSPAAVAKDGGGVAGGGGVAAAATPATSSPMPAAETRNGTGGEASAGGTPQPAATPAAGDAAAAAAAAAVGLGSGLAGPAAAALAPGPIASAVGSKLTGALHMPAGGALRGNWEALWAALGKDHSHAGLVWNESCRRELRDALSAEESGLRARRQQVGFQASGTSLVWNHSEFKVVYPSLAKHTCIGGIYIRLLLDGADPTAIPKLPNVRDLFIALQHHLQCSDSHLLHAHTSSLSSRGAVAGPVSPAAVLQSSALSEVEGVQLLCVRAMTEVYMAHAAAVGAMESLPHMLKLLDLSLRRPLRHHLLQLMAAALAPANTEQSPQALRVARANAACLVEEGGVELLVDLAASAHEALDESLASVCGPSTTMLTSASHQPAPAATHLITQSGLDGGAKEWWYFPEGIIKDPKVTLREGDEDASTQGWGGGGGDAPGGPSSSTPDATGRVGPLSKCELLQQWKEGTVHGHTLCWAEGLAAPAPLASIRELRWLVSGGPPVLNARDVSRLALRCLSTLAELQPASDAPGTVLQPLPRVLRLLGSPRCLPHLVQLLLTRDPALVAHVAGLLETTLSHNEDALARLYRTGAFYFALSYAGSNMQELASLLYKSHLKQANKGSATTPSPGAPLAARSYLGHLLPESLLYTLDSYGPQAFASALCGESDTPELRWTHGMRWSRLLPQLASHLGDFPQRLTQNWGGLVWQYTPAPPVTYPELKEELWCHRYYLKALCDEVAFPDWPIVDHVQLLQALLADWRAELSRQPLSLSEGEACALLGITVGPGGVVQEEDMRKAYRIMARKYHPDKNPAGRPMFMRIQQAYERLQAGAAGGQGPQAWRIVLMLKAQSILFRRFKTVLAPYKYAGYPQLLEVLSSLHGAQTATGGGDNAAPGGAKPNGGVDRAPPPLSAASGFMQAEHAELTQAACELCWRTVCASHLNADELARCGGVSIICTFFQRLVNAGLLPEDVAPTSHEAVVATHLLRSIAGFAASEVARPQLAAIPGLLPNIVRCTMLRRAHAAAEAALVAVGHLCASSALQMDLVHVGVMAYLVPLMFWYDITVEEEGDSGPPQLPFTYLPLGSLSSSGKAGSKGGAPPEPLPSPIAATAHSFAPLELALVRPNEVRAHNLRAMMAVQVLGRLAGVLDPPYRTPDCLVAQHALGTLLTHGLAVKMRGRDPRPLLVLLNSGQESAQIIWNASMRDELLALMKSIRSEQNMLSGGGAAGAGQDTAGGSSGVHESPARVAAVDRILGWQFKALKGELQVGGIFVRVYNANPSALPPDVQGFCKALVRFLYDAFVTSAAPGAPRHPSLLMTGARETDLAHTVSVLRALAALLDAEPRLLGLLASKSAVAPMVSALQVAETHAFMVAGPLDATTPRGGSHHAAESVSGAPGSPAALGGTGLEPAVGSPAGQLSEAALAVLQRMVAHVGCLEALSDIGTVRLLFHTVHCAPSPQALRQALSVLQALAGQASAGVVAADQAGALLLLVLLLHPQGAPWPWPGGLLPGGSAAEEGVMLEVAALLARLMASPTHGTAITVQIQRLLPPALVSTIASSPPTSSLAALRGRVSNPELVWEPHMAQQAAAQLAVLAHQARVHQAAPGASPVWSLPAGLNMTYHQLEGELRVGGVYCRMFLKDPQFPLKEPMRFGEGLAQALIAAMSPSTATPAQSSDNTDGGLPRSELVLLLSASMVALLKHHKLVADNLVSQGYVPKFLALLAARLPPSPPQPTSAGGSQAAPSPEPQQQSTVDEGGAVLRLLHALTASNLAAEALATVQGGPGAVPVLMGACAWGHAAEVLVLETMKRVLGPSNRNRDVLVNMSLQTGLIPFLLSRLEWQGAGAGAAGQSGESDLAVLRALAVDVITSLAEEGSFQAQVQALLDASSVWAAYRDQRHDLFLPSGAATEDSVAGLLTGAGTQQFALPAPERLNSAPVT